MLRQRNDQLANDFRDFIKCLDNNDVLFVLVGGYAVGWHGVVRATGDIDFLYERTEDNVERLCAAMRAFGAPENLIDPDFMLLSDAVTQIGHAPLRIDLLAGISGVSFADVRAGAVEAELSGSSMLVIGLNELRTNKAATGRQRDKDDLRRLARGVTPADQSSARLRTKGVTANAGKRQPRRGGKE